MSFTLLETLRAGVGRVYNRDTAIVGVFVFALSVFNTIVTSNLANALSPTAQSSGASFSFSFLPNPILAAIPVVIGFVLHITVMILLIKVISGEERKLSVHTSEMPRPTAHVIAGIIAVLGLVLAVFLPASIGLTIGGKLAGLSEMIITTITRLLLAVSLLLVVSLTIFSIPEIIVKNTSFIQGIRNSIELTENNRIRVMVIIVVAALLISIIGAIGGIINNVLGLYGILGFFTTNVFSAIGIILQWGIIIETYERLIA